MTKFQKLFRYLWRINAVLILVATGAITFGVGALVTSEFGARSARSREVDAGVPVAADSNVKFSLGNASAVPGTNVLRAKLSLDRGGAGFSSGGYTETRNILFIEPQVSEPLGVSGSTTPITRGDSTWADKNVRPTQTEPGDQQNRSVRDVHRRDIHQQMTSILLFPDKRLFRSHYFHRRVTSGPVASQV